MSCFDTMKIDNEENSLKVRKTLVQFQKQLDVYDKSLDILKLTKEITVIDKSVEKSKQLIKKSKAKKTRRPQAHVSQETDTSQEDNVSDDTVMSSLPNIPDEPNPSLSSANSKPQADPVVAAPLVQNLTPFLGQPKILIEKDSVSEVANIRTTEIVNKYRIRSARVTTNDNLENTVKSNL